MVKDVIPKDPDFIVLVINPFWDMNDWSIFRRPEVFNKGTSLWTGNNDWYFNPIMSSPKNILTTYTLEYFPIYEKSIDYALSLKSRFENKNETNNATDLRNDEVSNKALQNKPMKEREPQTQYQFWMKYINTDEYDGGSKYQQVISSSSYRSDDLSYNILKNAIIHIKKSQIKTLIYIAPVSKEVKSNPYTSISYQKFINSFTGMATSLQADNINYILEIPLTHQKDLVFRDDAHVDEAKSMVDFLAGEIQKQLTN